MLTLDDWQEAKSVVDFGRCSGYISKALRYAGDTHSVADVAQLVAAGAAQFWPGPASCIVTQIVDAPPKPKLIHFWLAGARPGHLPEIQAMLPAILDWARESEGCKMASLAGRPGWERSFLVDEGWTVASRQITMEKAL